MPVEQPGDIPGPDRGGRSTLALGLARILAGALVGLALVWLVGRPLGLSFNSAVYAFVGMALAAIVGFFGQPVFRRAGRVIDKIAERDARSGAARVGLYRPWGSGGEDAEPGKDPH